MMEAFFVPNSVAGSLVKIHKFGQKLKGSSFLGVVFAKGCEFLLVSWGGRGFEVGFRWVVGGVVLL